MIKKIKLISLISTPILIGGGFAALTLVNQCGDGSVHYNLNGTNWKGYKSGSLSCTKLGSGDAYVISASSSYNALNWVIPDKVWDEKGNSFPLIALTEDVFSIDSNFVGSLTIGNNIAAIHSGCFSSACGSVNLLTIPSSVQTIESYAFSGLGSSLPGTISSTTDVVTLKLINFDWPPNNYSSTSFVNVGNPNTDADNYFNYFICDGEWGDWGNNDDAYNYFAYECYLGDDDGDSTYSYWEKQIIYS